MFETGSLYVVLAVLELTMEIRLDKIIYRVHLPLPCDGIHHYVWPQRQLEIILVEYKCFAMVLRHLPYPQNGATNTPSTRGWVIVEEW